MLKLGAAGADPLTRESRPCPLPPGRFSGPSRELANSAATAGQRRFLACLGPGEACRRAGRCAGRSRALAALVGTNGSSSARTPAWGSAGTVTASSSLGTWPREPATAAHARTRPPRLVPRRTPPARPHHLAGDPLALAPAAPAPPARGAGARRPLRSTLTVRARPGARWPVPASSSSILWPSAACSCSPSGAPCRDASCRGPGRPRPASSTRAGSARTDGAPPGAAGEDGADAGRPAGGVTLR